MFDLSLGGPVDTEETSEAHTGTCTDSPYGCIRCHNGANNGRGTMSTCDCCKKETFTRITRAIDEPAMYAMCGGCRKKQNDEAERELERMGGMEDW